MDETTKKILEIVTDMQENNATKDDIRNLQAQITENTKAIAQMAEDLRSVFGYAKEIDALMTRMTIVEKQLGIAK